MSDKKKYRGSGTHGGGSKKKRRGAGSRGGRGKSGNKHQKLKYNKKKEKGFKTLKKEQKVINLKQLEPMLDDLLENNKAEKEGDEIIVNLSELGYDKLLGSGKISQPLTVKSKKFSDKAIEKLEEAGGKAVELS